MALNFGHDLFSGGDDDLRPRWQQSVSSLINNSSNFDEDDDIELHAVTSGKTAYITKVLVSVSTAFDDDIAIKDDATVKLILRKLPTGLHDMTFNTPLVFSTSVDLNASTPTVGTGAITITGWEE